MPRSRSFRSNRHVCGGVAPNVAGTTSIFAIVSLVLVTGGSSVKAATCADLLINVTSDKACTACLTGRDSLNCVYCALPGEETCTSDQERRTCALQYTVNEQQVENPDCKCHFPTQRPHTANRSVLYFLCLVKLDTRRKHFYFCRFVCCYQSISHET